jgi:transposase
MLPMTAPIRLRLDQATRAAVSERYEQTRGAVERTNCQIVLLADEGRQRARDRLAGTARTTSSTQGSVSVSGRGLAGLAPRKAPGRALEVTPAWLAELKRVIDLDPHEVGVASAVWTTRLLSGYLEQATGHHAAIETVRMYLHHLGYVCKRPTWSMKRKSTEQAGWVKNA